MKKEANKTTVRGKEALTINMKDITVGKLIDILKLYNEDLRVMFTDINDPRAELRTFAAVISNDRSEVLRITPGEEK